MNGLMLHAGAASATLDEITAVATPEATEKWAPIPHRLLLDTVVGELTRAGMRVTDQAFGLWDGRRPGEAVVRNRRTGKVEEREPLPGARFFAVVALKNGTAHDDYQLIVGLRNSHDQSMAAGLALGSRVFICDNMAFSGEVTFGRKHTVNIVRDLPGLANRAVAKLHAIRGFQDKRIAAYKERTITENEAHDFIIHTIDNDVLKVTKLHDLLHEWREPKHEVFKERNVWSLFNAYTEVSKGAVTHLAKRTITLHGMCDTLVGLEVPTVHEEN